MNIRRTMRALGCAAVLASLLAACGSDGSSADGAAGDTSTTEAKAPAGVPIKVGTIAATVNMPQVEAGVSAAMKSINAAGGVAGRPLELVTCDDQNDANRAAECARKFAADDSIVATVGLSNYFGGDANPVFEQASLAGIGTAPLGSGDFNSPVVFPTNIGTLIFLGAAAMAHDRLDAKKTGMVYVDTPTAAALGGLIDKLVLGPRGAKLSRTAAIPATAADLAPQASAVGDTDALGVALQEQLSIRFVRTARQQGYAGKLIVSATQLTADQIAKDLSGFSQDLYAVGWYDYSSAGYKNMLAEAKKYKPEATTGDLFANSWLSTHLFADVAGKLSNISRSSVLEAMKGLKAYETRGMTAPLDYTVKATAMGGRAARLVPSVAKVYAYRFEGGRYAPVGDGAIDVFGATP